MRLLWSRLVLVFALLGVGYGMAVAEPSGDGCFRGLSQDGTAGTLDLPSADPGCPWRLRSGAYLGGFVEDGYVIVGDRFRSIAGGMAMAATIGRHVELGLQLGAQLGRAEQIGGPLAGTTAPSLLSMSQLKVQLKLFSPWGRYVHVALLPSVRVPGTGQDFVPAPLNTDVSIDGLLQVSLQPKLPFLPLRLSMLLGYAQDRSLRALDAQDCMGGTVADCLRVRLESTAAYGVGLPRVRGSLGVELPLSLHRFLSITPAVIYRIEAIVGDPDPVLIALFGMGFPGAPLQSRFQQWLTIGGRLGLGIPLAIDFGVRVGLQSAGYAMGAKLPKVMGFGGLSWELDLLGDHGAGGRSGSLTKAQPSPSTEPVRCRVSGTVRDAQTGQALADAVVAVAEDEVRRAGLMATAPTVARSFDWRRIGAQSARGVGAGLSPTSDMVSRQAIVFMARTPSSSTATSPARSGSPLPPHGHSARPRRRGLRGPSRPRTYRGPEPRRS